MRGGQAAIRYLVLLSIGVWRVEGKRGAREGSVVRERNVEAGGAGHGLGLTMPVAARLSGGSAGYKKHQDRKKNLPVLADELGPGTYFAGRARTWFAARVLRRWAVFFVMMPRLHSLSSIEQ